MASWMMVVNDKDKDKGGFGLCRLLCTISSCCCLSKFAMDVLRLRGSEDNIRNHVFMDNIKPGGG